MANKGPVSFTVKRSPRSRQFRCVIRTEGNHEITFTGEPCHNRKDVRETIDHHIAAIKEGRFVIVDPAPVKRAKKKSAGRRTTKATS